MSAAPAPPASSSKEGFRPPPYPYARLDALEGQSGCSPWRRRRLVCGEPV